MLNKSAMIKSKCFNHPLYFFLYIEFLHNYPTLGFFLYPLYILDLLLCTYCRFLSIHFK